jgi:hypothetical protein
MTYLGENEFYMMLEQVKVCQTQQRPDIKLEVVAVLCQMLQTQPLDDDMAEEIKKMEKFTKGLLTNPEFRRKVNKRQALIEREPIVYFGQETLKDDEYDFDEELEKDLTDIQFKITTFLGNIMAYIQEQGSI